MRKPLILATIVVAGVFGTGYAIGQVSGVTASSAAGTGTTATTGQSGSGTTLTRPAAGPHADGQVTAINGDTITIKADADQAGSTEYTKVTTVVLTSGTTYNAGRDAAASTTKPTITVGQYLIAEGTVSNDGTTLTATNVSVGDAGGRPGGPGGPGFAGGPHADGTVTAVSGNTITIKADADKANSNEQKGVTTLILTSSTQYRADHDRAATEGRSSITVGSYLRAEGTLSSDGTTLTASQVDVSSGAPGVGGWGGSFH